MACTNRKGSAEANSLTELIANFLKNEGCCPRDEEEMKAFQGKPIVAAIRKAARARDNNGKLYPHQWNLEEKYPDVPEKAERILVNCADNIAACNNFDVLHNLITDELKLKGHVKGAGEMYCYDTAFRIGISMGAYPQKVYLHRGTRDGAIALGIYEDGKEVLEMSELEKIYPEFGKMKPHQVEDFLCIEHKKGNLRKFKRA
jgi:hypothetical protein